MDASVLDVALTLSGELLAQVGAVLVLDVFNDRVPAAIVVDKVAVAGSVDNVQAQAHAVLLDDVCDGMNFGGAADWLGGRQTALAIDEVRGEDGVDEGRLAEASLSCNAASLSVDVSTIPMLCLGAYDSFPSFSSYMPSTYQHR